MKVGVILASHGEFARAALGSVEMIAGPQPDVQALALGATTSLEDFEAAFREAWGSLSSSCDHVVVLCDILGGTPFNVVARAKAAGLPLTAYAGLSLPVVIELLLCRDQWADPEELSRAVEAAASRAFQAIEVPDTDEADEGDL